MFTGRWRLTQHISLFLLGSVEAGRGGITVCAQLSYLELVRNYVGEPGEKNKNLLPLTY